MTFLTTTKTLYLFLLSLGGAQLALAGLPDKIYGVGLGGWLLVEPWIFPDRWTAMGGEICNDCTTCVATEADYAKKYSRDKVDREFEKHWETWFNFEDVVKLKALRINTIRIPVGYWIIEALVDQATEKWPRGGLKHLRRGLNDLHNLGFKTILDLHGAPGAQAVHEAWTGQCTSDLKFFTPENYHRALTWTAVMGTLSHLQYAGFGQINSIEAANEPYRDASMTPGFGDYQKNFVSTLRAVELTMGLNVPGWSDKDIQRTHSRNFTEALITASNSSLFNAEVQAALKSAAPILGQLASEFKLHSMYDFSPDRYRHEELVVATFMNKDWQWGDAPNPHDAERGPQAYDGHLYYLFGGVADPNEEAYMTSICNLDRLESAQSEGNVPFFMGEWSVGTQWNSTDEFYRKWADAQKWQYSRGAGWSFWNFKTDAIESENKKWSYYEGIKRGYLTLDPSRLHDPKVCDPYRNATTMSSQSITHSPKKNASLTLDGSNTHWQGAAPPPNAQ